MADSENPPSLREQVSTFRYTPHAVKLVWMTSKRLSIAMAGLAVVSGVTPAAIAWVGKQIVDSVVRAIDSGDQHDLEVTLSYVLIEFALIFIVAGATRAKDTCTTLLRALLAQKVNELILEKALTLDLQAFEDATVYDSMTKARREASRRPLSVVWRLMEIVQNALSLAAYGALLINLSVWAVLLLAAAAIPAFVAETKFSRDAFRLFSWRAPEARMQDYLETLIAREDHVKEVKLFGLGPKFFDRYHEIFEKVYDEDRALQIRRSVWGFAFEVVSTVALYGAYVWIVLKTVARSITLGDMTMYLMLFKQGQSALSALLGAVRGMYEDNLYLSNLYDFLAHPTTLKSGSERQGAKPGDGLRLDGVSFSYPGAKAPALQDVTLHIRAGQKLALVGQNGAGKTTLIKLLTRLYEPTSGTITLDGTPLQDWDVDTLRQRIGVIFQDFVRYQLLAGENIGVGDVRNIDNEEKWRVAAKKGMADETMEALPNGYQTPLGRWFGGQELSLGQWQKVALSRSFMREDADILVLDEPTASMDAEAEATIFERFRSLAENRIAILISHRFSTVRMADEIVVLENGKIVERGSHEELLSLRQKYARLFELQAAGYR